MRFYVITKETIRKLFSQEKTIVWAFYNSYVNIVLRRTIAQILATFCEQAFLQNVISFMDFEEN